MIRHSNRLLSFVLICFLLIACGPQYRGEHEQFVEAPIVGGVAAEAPFYNVVVEIHRLSQGQVLSICTGSILDRNTILTAAHCVASRRFLANHRIMIRVNSFASENIHQLQATNVLRPSEDRSTSFFARHFDLDVALLKVNIDFDLFTSFIPLANTSEIESLDAINIPAVLAGYGLRDDGTAGMQLHKVSTSLDYVDDNFLHFNSPDKNARPGDSGGPAFMLNGEHRWRQIGVASHAKAIRTGFGPFASVVYEGSRYLRSDIILEFIEQAKKIKTTLVSLRDFLQENPLLAVGGNSPYCQFQVVVANDDDFQGDDPFYPQSDQFILQESCQQGQVNEQVLSFSRLDQDVLLEEFSHIELQATIGRSRGLLDLLGMGAQNVLVKIDLDSFGEVQQVNINSTRGRALYMSGAN